MSANMLYDGKICMNEPHFSSYRKWKDIKTKKTSGADFTTNLHFWIYRTVKIINENYISQPCYENHLNMSHKVGLICMQKNK
jgi:hypothetical protein